MFTLWFALACKDGVVPATDDSEPLPDTEQPATDDSEEPRALADLRLDGVVKGADTFTVSYCNEGEAAGTISISLRLMNVDTTAAKEWGGNAFPEVGACVDSRAVDCADVGLDCANEVVIEAVVDPYDAVRESDESDNRGTFRL